MFSNPGKYDPEVREALSKTQAGAALLIVIDGIKGSGFSIAINVMKFVPPMALSTMLRAVADDIERLERSRGSSS